MAWSMVFVAAGGQTMMVPWSRPFLGKGRKGSRVETLTCWFFFPTIVFFCISFNIHLSPHFSMDDRRSIFFSVVTCLHPALPWRATWHKLICHPRMMKARKSFLERLTILSGSNAWSGYKWIEPRYALILEPISSDFGLEFRRVLAAETP